jgi:WD40 repeat protein
LKGHTGVIRAVDGYVDASGNATLVSAGDDKDVHVWVRNALTAQRWVHRRTIRWPVIRGPRGRIYSVALADDRVALAGHGATGGLGEIWVIDVGSGELVRSLVNARQADQDVSHRQNIANLCWSPSPPAAPRDGHQRRLASADLEGRVLLWQRDETTGLWAGQQMIGPDQVTYGAAIAAALQPRRRFVPTAFLGAQQLVVAQYAGISEQPEGAARWQLQRIDVATGESKPIVGVDLIEFAITISTSDDGRTLLTSDAMGNAWRVRFDDSGEVIDYASLDTHGVPLWIDVHPDGHRCLLGTTSAEGEQVQLWDLQDDEPKQLSFQVSDGLSLAGLALPGPESDTSQQSVVAQENRLEIRSIGADGQLDAKIGQLLQSRIGKVTKVAFFDSPAALAQGPKREPDEREPPLEATRIAIGRDSQEVSEVFDLQNVKLLGQISIDAKSLVPTQRLDERWSARLEETVAGQRYRLFHGENAAGLLPLVPELHGVVTSIATLPDPNNAGSGAVLIGSSGRNGIYAFAADAAEPPQMLRQFRDHSGDVLTLSTSSDGRYLVSGSNDTTIVVWNLGDLFNASVAVNRWGAEFEVESDRLVADSVRDDGPLYFQGVRVGDVLTSISWADVNGNAFAEADPQRMRDQLQTLAFDTLVVFNTSRLGRPQQSFQSFAAWRPLATMVVDRDREWAFWTPAGYYDASINGHRRFGWQINRGVQTLPDYYRAAQFRSALERPDAMRQLLEKGSLPKAMRSTVAGLTPPPGDSAIVNQIRTQPVVRITQPEEQSVVVGNELIVRAEIDIPAGGHLIQPKAFVNGIPAVQVKRLSTAGSTDEFQWTFRLPRQPKLQVEVFAATEAQAVGRATREFNHRIDLAPGRRPRLHLLAIGVGDYRDSQIQSLDFAARGTSVVADTLERYAAPIYRVSTDRLTDRAATASLWQVYAQSAAERLAKEVQPDDLVVMYFCGHGLRDRQTNRWYFVTADARFRDLMDDRYDDCLSLDDLAVFSALPCTKLAILDSCHSGAVQTSMRPDDLKSALRFLQDDVVLTWTASEGDQEAVEKREDRLGRFTTHLVAALSGQADVAMSGNSDGLVSLREAIEFVSARVRQESQVEGTPQYPTVGPRDLIESIELPLSGNLMPALADVGNARDTSLED